MSDLPINERDFDVLRDMLKSIPPEVEFLVIANHSNILFNTIPEWKGQKSIDDTTLFNFVRSTSHEYFYQMVSPALEDNFSNVLLVSRVLRDHTHPPIRPAHRLNRYLIIFGLVFVLFCIIMIVHLSQTISRSITILEDNTQRIADGELDVKLTTGSSLKTTNEITRLSENLDKMRRALKDAAERRSRFIMGISHDLRTPVAVIKGYTEAIADGMISDGEEMKKTLELITTKTNQLETMIDTLINFVKLNNDDWRSQLTSQPLAPFLREFAESSVSTGGVFKRNVTAQIALDDAFEVPFDKQLFQRALENIFSNALRYTKENDSIAITAREEQYSSGAHCVFISITDSGEGIDDKDKSHIFDLFYRGTASRRESGMGIGLSVVKQIVDTHGWQIDVQSQKGSGTSFTITIPV